MISFEKFIIYNYSLYTILFKESLYTMYIFILLKLFEWIAATLILLQLSYVNNNCFRLRCCTTK